MRLGLTGPCSMSGSEDPGGTEAVFLNMVLCLKTLFNAQFHCWHYAPNEAELSLAVYFISNLSIKNSLNFSCINFLESGNGFLLSGSNSKIIFSKIVISSSISFDSRLSI